MVVIVYFQTVLKFNPQFQPAPRDYLQTREGLLFAVVSGELIHSNLVICCLRYIPGSDGLTKLSTNQANDYLETHYPQYLYYSKPVDTVVHVVPLAEIQQHFKPIQRLHQICMQPADNLELLASKVASVFVNGGLNADALGVSGSILISAHGDKSDIDLVVYGRENFFKAQKCLKQQLENNQTNQQHNLIQPLTVQQWQQTWERRGSDLCFDEYLIYEQRKYNKASIEGVKFDLSMVESYTIDDQNYTKQGSTSLEAVITDDSKAYDYPASYQIDHPQVSQILSYSATYAGQACVGELIEARGILEQSSDGQCRLVVGTSREATGEYLKVLKSETASGFNLTET